MALRITSILALAIAMLVLTLWTDARSLAIESLESRTVDGGPVYNEIRWIPGADRDVWMMNQSHDGPHASKRDRLAIVVDKKTKNARFYQLQPGALEWSEGLEPAPYRVSCFMCHSNGPRAIRPNVEGLALWDRGRVLLWNTRIKAYGRLKADPVHEADGFKLRGKFENEGLEVKTCRLCHKESGFLARGELKRQQFMTIKFMVESGQMPPLGLKLSKEERAEIDDFVKGL